MTTRGLPQPWRRRAKRAARKLARTHPADVERAVRAMDARDRAIRLGWLEWCSTATFVDGGCIEGMEPWESVS